MADPSRMVFHATVKHDSGRWCLWESDIDGLVFETDTLEEMKECIATIAPQILISNHSLKEKDLEDVEIHVKIESQNTNTFYSNRPKVLYEHGREVAVM